MSKKSLDGRIIVFRGKLSKSHKDAAKIACKAGAIVKTSFTKSVNLCVQGDSANKDSIPNSEDIEIWTEKEFDEACSVKTSVNAMQPPKYWTFEQNLKDLDIDVYCESGKITTESLRKILKFAKDCAKQRNDEQKERFDKLYKTHGKKN